MSLTTIFLIAGIAVVALVVLGFLAMCYKRINSVGEALVITRFGSTAKEAVLNGAFVWPGINQYERMDITRRRITISREGAKGKSGDQYEGLPCKDNIRANVVVAFYIGVSPEPKDILLVADNLTCAGASNIQTLESHLSPKFSEALKTVIKQFEFEELYNSRKEFRDAVKELLQNDMEGFKLYDVVIDKIEQTPLEALDPQNILDVDGIRKISQITAEKNIETSQIRQHEETETKKRTVDGETARLQLSRTLAEETEKTNREIAHIKIEEQKNVEIKKESTRLEVEQARISTAQQISISEENKNREIDVAMINNERVVEVQREQVNRTKEVEKVLTVREVAERNIETEKVVEAGKRDVAVTVAERTKTEREIAIEEEQTKDIRTKSQAEREKLVVVTESEASAKAQAVKAVTLSEADLAAAKNNVQKETLIADNQLVVASKQAEARERVAQAERTEKASVGLAEVDVRSAMAEVISKEATAQADQVRLVGLAEVEVKTQDADAIEKVGKAEATRVREIGLAEATSSEAQYKAMASIQPEVRQHELDKLNIDKDKEVQIADIKSRAEIASKNAEVMAAAMAKANIKVLGGGEFFDSVRKSIVASEALDERFNNSDVLKGILGKYVSGEEDIIKDLVSVLQKSDVSTGAVGNLAIAQSLAEMLKRTPQGETFLQQLLGGMKS